jgi:hypothetical protein
MRKRKLPLLNLALINLTLLPNVPNAPILITPLLPVPLQNAPILITPLLPVPLQNAPVFNLPLNLLFMILIINTRALSVERPHVL